MKLKQIEVGRLSPERILEIVTGSGAGAAMIPAGEFVEALEAEQQAWKAAHPRQARPDDADADALIDRAWRAAGKNPDGACIVADLGADRSGAPRFAISGIGPAGDRAIGLLVAAERAAIEAEGKQVQVVETTVSDDGEVR